MWLTFLGHPVFFIYVSEYSSIPLQTQKKQSAYCWLYASAIIDNGLIQWIPSPFSKFMDLRRCNKLKPSVRPLTYHYCAQRCERPTFSVFAVSSLFQFAGHTSVAANNTGRPFLTTHAHWESVKSRSYRPSGRT